LTTTPQPPTIAVPLGYPCSTFYIDESGARSSRGGFFVVAAVKVRQPGKLLREVKSIRDRNGGEQRELKFSRISRGQMHFYRDLVDALGSSDAHVIACVVDHATEASPFRRSEPPWRGHARVTAKVLEGGIVKRELATAMVDRIDTPTGVAMDDHLRTQVNRRLGHQALIGVSCVDSQCHDGVQLADLVAGAVRYQRSCAGNLESGNVYKTEIAQRMATVFGVTDWSDQRTERVNVLTYGSEAARYAGRVTSLRQPSSSA
jgi:hypothetical protein